MEVDVDAALQAMNPWDLTLKIKGKKHRVRATLVMDVGIFEKMTQMDMKQVRDTLRTFFDNPRPDTSTWGPDLIGAVLKEIGTYTQAWVKKKQEAAAAAGVGEAGEGGPSSASTGSSPQS